MMETVGTGSGGPGRRSFLRIAAAGVAATAAAMGAKPALAFSARKRAPVRRRPLSPQTEPWGRLVPVADGAWALVSTPLAEGPEARRTLCNGGIIAGRDAVMAIEGFATPAGAAWLGDQAERLTGQRPDRVVLSHYHGDHVGGTAGYLRGADPVRVLATETTRRTLAEREAALESGVERARQLVLPDTLLPDDGPPVEIDLGGRLVRLVARSGHTRSDLVVELPDGDVVWGGDLIWTGMFPNYVDAIPSRLSTHVRALREQRVTTYVSGHGRLADGAALDTYIDLLDHVEAAARRAIEHGTPLDAAGADYEVPASLGAWHMFSPRYPEMAFRAWARDLGVEPA